MLSKIGEGKFGIVYKVWMEELDVNELISVRTSRRRASTPSR